MQKHKFYSVVLPIISTMGVVLMLTSSNILIVLGVILIVTTSAIVAGILLYDRETVPEKRPVKPEHMHHAQRVTELEGLYHTLQSNYFRKTNELQDKIDDLERFHQLAIGRELRLIELKNEIAHLRMQQQPTTDPAATGSGSAT